MAILPSRAGRSGTPRRDRDATLVPAAAGKEEVPMGERVVRVALAARRWLPALTVMLIPLAESAKRW